MPTIEEKNEELSGTIINGNKILFVLRNANEGYDRDRWVVLAQCHCGRQYATLLRTLTSNTHPSCGCDKKKKRSKHRYDDEVLICPLVPDEIKSRFREQMNAEDTFDAKAIKQKVAHIKEREKTEKPKRKYRARRSIVHPHRSEIADVQGNLSKVRLTDYWENLPKDQLCPAWTETPFKFVEWAVKNGFATNKQLIRTDENRPYSPMNCTWRAL